MVSHGFLGDVWKKKSGNVTIIFFEKRPASARWSPRIWIDRQSSCQKSWIHSILWKLLIMWVKQCHFYKQMGNDDYTSYKNWRNWGWFMTFVLPTLVDINPELIPLQKMAADGPVRWSQFSTPKRSPGFEVHLGTPLKVFLVSLRGIVGLGVKHDFLYSRLVWRYPYRIHGAGIYANIIEGILMVNVTIYSIHGSYGLWLEKTHLP